MDSSSVFVLLGKARGLSREPSFPPASGLPLESSPFTSNQILGISPLCFLQHKMQEGGSNERGEKKERGRFEMLNRPLTLGRLPQPSKNVCILKSEKLWQNSFEKKKKME